MQGGEAGVSWGTAPRLRNGIRLQADTPLRRDAVRALLAADNAAVRPVRPAKLPTLFGFNSRRILPACTFSKPDAQHRAGTPSPGRWRGAEYYAHADKSMDWRDGMPEGLSTGDMSCFGRGACTGTACHGLSTRSGGVSAPNATNIFGADLT